MMLPPCINKMLSNFKSEYAPYIAGFFRVQNVPQKSVIDILSEKGIDVIVSVLEEYRRGKSIFSCEIIQDKFAELCDRDICPLLNNFDPLEMAKSIVEKTVYVADTGEMIVYFKNSDERFIFDYAKAIRSTRSFASEFIAKTVILLGVPIDLRPYKDPDTGEKVDPAFEFLMWLGKTAERVVSEDAYGIGSVLHSIIQSEPIVDKSEARYNDARVIIKEINGMPHLLIDVQYFRLRLRPVLGNQTSPTRINSILTAYGIRVVRARIGGERRYFYAFSSEVLQRLIGKTVEELVETPNWEEVIQKLGGEE